MEQMAGVYLYIFVMLVVFGLLGVKVYERTRPLIKRPPPDLPISDGDIVTAVRAGRIADAIELYGVLHRCDPAEATQAVAVMVARLKTSAADDAADDGSGSTPQDHRET